MSLLMVLILVAVILTAVFTTRSAPLRSQNITGGLFDTVFNSKASQESHYNPFCLISHE
jgi:hypothetical protein